MYQNEDAEQPCRPGRSGEMHLSEVTTVLSGAAVKLEIVRANPIATVVFLDMYSRFMSIVHGHQPCC